ncbi:hypothetical protein D3C86_2206010 [compost metagenome]
MVPEVVILDGNHGVNHKLGDFLVGYRAPILFRTKLADRSAVAEIGEGCNIISAYFLLNHCP